MILSLSSVDVLLPDDAGHPALRLSGQVEPEVQWRELTLRGRAITYRHAGGATLSEDELVSLGAAYWEASRRRWEARRAAREDRDR